jgi:ribosomal protein S18 acetylase RimI-like enzyme
VKRELADGLSIRRGEVDEAVALARLASEVDDPSSAAALDLLAAAGRVFVAVSDDPAELLGLAAAGEFDGALAVESLGVLTSQRGRGIGSALVTTIEEYGRWAYFGIVLIVARDGEATEFLFRRGYLALDAARLPPALAQRAAGRTVLSKRL